MKRARLKPQSTRKAAHKRLTGPLRKKFVEAKGVCEVLGDRPAIECHEIANGAAKEECEKHTDLQLAVSREGHEIVQGWSEVRQFALRIERSRQTLNRIRGRADSAISREDVIREWVKL